jgi:hypothetical protein
MPVEILQQMAFDEGYEAGTEDAGSGKLLAEAEACNRHPTLLQTSLQVGMGDRPALMDLPTCPGERCQELRITFAREPLEIVVIERHQERDRVPVPHDKHLLLLRLAHGGFPGGVFGPYYGLHGYPYLPLQRSGFHNDDSFTLF